MARPLELRTIKTMIQDFKSEIKLFLLVALVAVVLSVVGILLLRAMESAQAPTPPPAAQQRLSVETAIESWKSYTYPSSESGILPTITFEYPSALGDSVTTSSRKANSPQFLSDNWGGFLQFKPTGTLADGLRLEFYRDRNLESTFPNYIEKQAGIAWDSIKYFETDGLNAARMRFSSPSHADADVAWYFVELPDKDILAISTSGNKELLYDDDAEGNSTRDKIISTLQLTETIDTSDWQTYRNDEFGFEIKYPEDWEEKENGVLHKATGSELSIIKNNNLNNLTLDEWFQEATVIGGRPTVKAGAESININGVKAYRLDSDLPPPALYFEIVAIADTQGNIYSIYGNYQVDEDANILDQILSTFRFINDSTSTWKTFQSERFVFEFQYPNDWEVGEYAPGALHLIGVLPLTSERLPYIGISSYNRTISGISYCEAYPDHKGRCEKFISGNASGMIEWFEDYPTHATALIDLSDEVTLAVSLGGIGQFNKIPEEIKEFFRTFVSTFRFVE